MQIYPQYIVEQACLKTLNSLIILSSIQIDYICLKTFGACNSILRSLYSQVASSRGLTFLLHEELQTLNDCFVIVAETFF